MAEKKLEEDVTLLEKMGLLNEIKKEYYPLIFKLVSSTVVLGNKKKYNTLVYLENKIMTADKKQLRELGFPVDDPVKTELVKTIIVKCIEISKDIRRDQWKTASNETKVGEFEARKHLTEEAVIDRNVRMMKIFNIEPELASEYGIALSVEDLKEGYKVDDEKRAKMIKKSMKDPAFKQFSENFQTVYKLGEPTNENTNFLYSIYEDLKKGEENSFGLKGYSLRTALEMVESTIRIRRNTFNFNDERKNKKEEQEPAEQVEKE